MEYVAQSQGMDAPKHLAPLVDRLERVGSGESVNALVSTPPQHGKSTVALHALVWLLQRDPTKRHAFITYAQAFSRDQTLKAQRIARERGLMLERDTLDRWVTPEGGGVIWTSRGGPFSGHPVDGIVIVDDILKDREEANSRLVRDTAHGWLSSVAFTRMHPNASFVLIGTRWHLDDPIGRLADEGGYEIVRLAAVKDDGTALWPEHRPLEWLMRQRERMLSSDWSALYMARPIAQETQVFGPSTYYEELPKGGFREGHGFDAAYTLKTTSDYTVTLSGRTYQSQPERIYLTNLIRRRAEPHIYIPLMRDAGALHVHWHAGGAERGTASLLKREGIRVTLLPTTSDKLARAIPAVTAWNRGDVLLPRNAPWSPEVESELSRFTGNNDPHDDIVDALAALHDGLLARPKPLTPEQRRSISPW